MRKLLIGLAVVVLAVAGFIVRTLWIAGSFKTIEPHFAGKCRLIDGPVGAEDITIRIQTGTAYISATDRRAIFAGKPVPGAIFSYDIRNPNAEPVNLTPYADVTFQPHGISLWSDTAGNDVLFVVNHPPEGTNLPANTVEIFDIRPEKLVHRATLTDPLLVAANDIVAVGIDRFYVTNTHQHGPGVMQTAETYLRLRGAQVVFYGNGGFRPVLSDIQMPNGINVSHDGRTLYVAGMTERTLRIYDRNPETETLTLRDKIFLGTGVDNIEIAEDGAAWIGAHPQLLRTAAHAADPAALAPTQVLRVAPDGTVEEVYLNDGSEISGGSVAAVYAERMLIGQILGSGFLDCLLTPPSS